MEVPLAQGAVRGAEDGGCLRFMGIPFVSTCLASGGLWQRGPWGSGWLWWWVGWLGQAASRH